MRQALVVLLLLAGAGLSAPVPKELKKQLPDKQRIVGVWRIDRATKDGKELARFEPHHTLTFRADGVIVFTYSDGDTPQSKSWAIDEAADPKQVTWGSNANRSDTRRLYAFRGDRLFVARGKDGELPASVDPGPGITVVEYVRAEVK